VSYLEAEAAVVALRDLDEEVVLPLEGGAAKCDAAGMRLPPETVEQAQQLVLDAAVRGMLLAHQARQAWCVVNGAIYAWNAFLPRLAQQRCAHTSSVV